ncbi:MAG: hypothetical protein VKJ64_03515 [Leptolyngbyaceae bacterium]|nr:hypothetical protein [Leptolyngbyaceae bacterium]
MQPLKLQPASMTLSPFNQECMTSASSFTAAERIMSLKAAVLGGFGAGLVSLVIVVLRRSLTLGTVFPLPGLSINLATLTLLANAGIATLSGALFALTYRYAVRRDTNVQLKSGVVLAFTLVRGLAQVDAGSAIAQHLWPFAVACGESLVMFGLTAMILNFAMQRQWIKPFGPH